MELEISATEAELEANRKRVDRYSSGRTQTSIDRYTKALITCKEASVYLKELKNLKDDFEKKICNILRKYESKSYQIICDKVFLGLSDEDLSVKWAIPTQDVHSALKTFENDLIKYKVFVAEK